MKTEKPTPTKTQTQVDVEKHADGIAETDVLYQKMGNRWFAFSMIDDEVFVGSISQEEIDESEKVS